MKKFVFMLVALIVTMFAGTSFAFSPPQPNGFVTDASGKLSSSEIAALNAKCQRINTSTGNEIAILVVPTLGGSSIEDAAQDTWSSWKIGKGGLDNGVLLMLAMNEHKSRIQTGKGVEGDLPDLKTQDILIKMRPYLRSGNLAGALNFGVDQISATLESRKGQKADPKVAPGATFDRQANPTVPMQAPDTSSTSSRNASCNTSGIGLVAVSPVLLAGGVLLLGLFLMRRARRRTEAANKARLEEIGIIQRQQKWAAQQMVEARKREARLAAEKEALPKPTLSFPPHAITRNNEPIESDVYKLPTPKPKTKAKAIAAAGIVAGTAAAAEASRLKLQRDEEDRRARSRREDEERRARDRRDEEDRRRRDSESSSYSSGSSSSWDSGGSSGGGFGGGDSGGGGSSSDW